MGLLCEHVYTMWLPHSKWLSKKSNESTSNFTLSLNIPCRNYLMIQKAAAMGNWWLAASSQKRTCSCITSHAECFGNISNHPGDRASTAKTLVPCNFWLFPKLKSPLRGKRFQIIDEIQDNMTGQLIVIGRTVEVPRWLLWRGLRFHWPTCNVSCIFN